MSESCTDKPFDHPRLCLLRKNAGFVALNFFHIQCAPSRKCTLAKLVEMSKLGESTFDTLLEDG
jgi:hypothetical protein